jgi:uncharacterized DUF497 family protein
MQITYDPDKDLSNQEKHGISLAEAERIEWDSAMECLDDQQDYGEERYIGFGFIGDRLYCVVYVDRDDGRRIISLRRANKREVQNYVDENQ